MGSPRPLFPEEGTGKAHEGMVEDAVRKGRRMDAPGLWVIDAKGVKARRLYVLCACRLAEPSKIRFQLLSVGPHLGSPLLAPGGERRRAGEVVPGGNALQRKVATPGHDPHQSGELLVGEERVRWDSGFFGPALSELPEPREGGERLRRKHLPMIDLARLRRLALALHLGRVNVADADRVRGRRALSLHELPIDGKDTVPGEECIELRLGRRGVKDGNREESKSHVFSGSKLSRGDTRSPRRSTLPVGCASGEGSAIPFSWPSGHWLGAA